MSHIADNIASLRERIATAAARAGRNPNEITLVAVTKRVESAQIREAVEAGIQDLGENYYQEARDKIPLIGESVRWHFMGHLQINKAKYIPGQFHLLHSLDSEELAIELDRRSAQKEILQNVLIEVKLDPSATKNGIEPALLPALTERLLSCRNLRLMGLMGMPPAAESPDDSRPFFARLRNMLEQLPEQNRSVLSMGMTADFEAAILEGSTMVRIGTAIFGPRGRP